MDVIPLSLAKRLLVLFEEDSHAGDLVRHAERAESVPGVRDVDRDYRLAELPFEGGEYVDGREVRSHLHNGVDAGGV